MPVYRPVPGPYVGPQPFAGRTVAPVAGADVTVTLSGSEAASSTGLLTPALGLSISGSVASSAAGTLAPRFSIDLGGTLATSAIGTLGLNVTISLAGTQAASATGTVTPSQNDVTIMLSGSAATTSTGTLSVSRSIALTGSQARTYVGKLKPKGGNKLIGGSRVRKPNSWEQYNEAEDVFKRNNQIIQAIMAAVMVLDEIDEYEEMT